MKSKRWLESKKKLPSSEHQEDTTKKFNLEPFSLATSHGKGPRGTQVMEIFRRDVWNVCEFLASSALLGEVEGIDPEP